MPSTQLEQIKFWGEALPGACSPPYPGEGRPAVTALPVLPLSVSFSLVD